MMCGGTGGASGLFRDRRSDDIQQLLPAGSGNRRYITAMNNKTGGTSVGRRHRVSFGRNGFSERERFSQEEKCFAGKRIFERKDLPQNETDF